MRSPIYRFALVTAFVLIIIPVVAWESIDGSPISDTPQTIQTGGTQQTTSPHIQITEVDELDHDEDAHNVESPAGSHPHVRTATLEEMKSEFGEIRVPSSTPKGFVLRESEIIGDPGDGHTATSVYFDPKRKLQLFISEFTGSARPFVKRGYSRPVSVNGNTGYLISGIWGRLTKDGVTHPIEWEPHSTKQLMFQIGDRGFLVMVGSYPAKKGFTDDDLIRVAESLVPHEDGGN